MAIDNDKKQKAIDKKNQARDAAKAGRDKVSSDRNIDGTLSKSLSDIARAVGVSNKEEIQANSKSDIKLIGASLDSEVAKKASEKIEKVFDSVSSGTRKERKEAKKESKLLKELIKNINDPEEKELVRTQIGKLDDLIASDKKILESTTKAFGKIAAPLAGVVAGLAGDSPWALAAGYFAVGFIQDKLEKRKARKEKFKKIALESAEEEDKRIFEEARDKSLEEAANKKSENESETAEKMNNAAVTMSEAVAEFADKVDDKSPVDKPILEVEKMSSSKELDISNITSPQDAEFNKEQITRDTENAERTGEIIVEALEGKSNNDNEKSAGLFSMFGKGGLLSKLKVGLFGLLGATSFGKFFGGFTKLLKGFGSKIMKFAKKLPIIGLFLSGKGIFDEIGALPDNASLMDKIFAGIKGAADGAIEFFLGIPIMLIDWLAGTDISGFVKSEGGITQTIGNAMSSVFKLIGDTIESTISSIKAFLEKTIRSIPYIGEDLADSIFDKENSKKSVKELNESFIKNNDALKEARPEGFFETAADFAADLNPFADSRAERDAKIFADQEQISINRQILRREAQIKASSEASPKSIMSSNVVQMNASRNNVNTINQSVISNRPTSRNMKTSIPINVAAF